MPAVRSDLRKRKALEWLIEHVEIVDEDGNPIDRAALEPRASRPEDDRRAKRTTETDAAEPTADDDRRGATE